MGVCARTPAREGRCRRGPNGLVGRARDREIRAADGGSDRISRSRVPRPHPGASRDDAALDPGPGRQPGGRGGQRRHRATPPATDLPASTGPGAAGDAREGSLPRLCIGSPRRGRSRRSGQRTRRRRRCGDGVAASSSFQWARASARPQSLRCSAASPTTIDSRAWRIPPWAALLASCPRWESNPHFHEFKSRPSAGWGTGANSHDNGPEPSIARCHGRGSRWVWAGGWLPGPRHWSSHTMRKLELLAQSCFHCL